MAVSRCVSPRSMVRHSAAVITRGSRSKGKIRSVPCSSPYTVNVMPCARNALSASVCRRPSSALEVDCSSFEEGPAVRVWLAERCEHLVVRRAQLVCGKHGSQDVRRRFGDGGHGLSVARIERRARR